MIRNIFTIAIRNLIKHKLYSLINVLGLTIGFTAYILISAFLKYEYSWDKSNEKYDRIYRAQVKLTLAGKQDYWTQTPSAITDLLAQKYPEFEKVILMREAWGEFLSTSTNRPFHEQHGFYADPQIFDIFTYQFIQGDKNTALSEPFSMVLSKKLADKLFPKGDALGNSVLIEKKFNVKVTGVYKDLPESSHIRPTYITSMQTLKTTRNWPEYRSNWGFSFRNYVLLKKGVDPKEVDKKIANVINANHKDDVVQQIYLRPLSLLYLLPTNNTDYLVAIFSYALVALFIIILAATNYINLATANASLRSKEIAIRKVSGSKKSSLIGQFLGETAIISLIAANFAIIFSNLLLPTFNNIVEKEIDYSYINNWHFMGYILGVALSVGIISGVYPAFLLSSFKPVNLLKGDTFKPQKSKVGPKKVLVTVQYVISIFLLILTIIVYKQTTHMMNKDVGFNKENLLHATISSTKDKINFEAFRSKVLENPFILNASYSQNIPFHGSNGWIMNWEGNPSNEKIDMRYNEVSFDYINTLQMKIVMGRDFSRSYPGDKEKGCIINETACKRFGWTSPIDKMIDGRFRVIGVVKDFHPYSMHERIPPFLIRLTPTETYGNGVYTFRIAPGHLAEAKKMLTEELEASFPKDPFEFKVFTEDFKRDGNFKTWMAINRTLLFFTVLIILLTIIGIYGLVSFTTTRKTKEIGIRKVHGSSLHTIYFKLVKEFMILLFVAVLIAWPSSYIMYKYIPGSYKYTLQIWEFLIATSVVLIITLLTTSYQIVKVTMTNPIKALRYE